MPCVFCQIIAGESPARIIYRDSDMIAIHDIAPQAPTHILVLPVRHIASLADTQDDDGTSIGRDVPAGSGHCPRSESTGLSARDQRRRAGRSNGGASSYPPARWPTNEVAARIESE
jgi:histidine triad (HIT) family protein